MNLGEIRQILDANGIQLTKSLGQNFLHDPHQLRRIISAADLSSADQVLEVGPGLGALTQLLVGKVPHVLAIEKDQRLYHVLQRRWPQDPRLTLVRADALEYLQTQPADWTNWKLVSNLPYSVASAILVQMAKSPKPPARLAVTLQMEVAQRLVATANQGEYGLLSLLVQVSFEPGPMFKIPAACFFPVPSIDSACITLNRRAQPLVDLSSRRTFEKVVKRGFSQRRKMMLKLLKADWPIPILQNAFEELGIPAQARAETVSLVQFIGLTERLVRAANPL
jgi:16S rRNA (adenine1518-N6/adenine1519-N6)-dimethyltransferase